MYDYLVRAGVPESLAGVDSDYLTEDNQNRLKAWRLTANRNMPVTVITGKNMIEKERFMVCIAREFLKIGKTVFFGSITEALEQPSTFSYILLYSSVVSKLKLNEVQQMILNRTNKQLSTVLEFDTMDEFKSMYSDKFYNMISSRIVEIHIPTENQGHIRL